MHVISVWPGYQLLPETEKRIKKCVAGRKNLAKAVQLSVFESRFPPDSFLGWLFCSFSINSHQNFHPHEHCEVLMKIHTFL